MHRTLDRQAFSLVFKPQHRCIHVFPTVSRHNGAVTTTLSRRQPSRACQERSLSTHVSPMPDLSNFRRRNAADFSTSRSRRATKVTLNPQVDEEGKTLTIAISRRAAERLREITDPSSASISTTLKENPYHHLRITVTSGGCHGFQYLMSLESASQINEQDDTVFEAEVEPSGTADDTTAVGGEAKVVMDTPSLELLSGSTVDYTTELIGSQFKIIDNPRATSNCGCGTSFDVKD